MNLNKRTYIRYIRLLLATVALLSAMTACSDAADAPAGSDTGDSGKASAGFYITVGRAVANNNGSGRISRAPEAGVYDPGAGYENYIDIDSGDFRFYFFNASNRYITSFEPTSILPVSGDDISKVYYVNGKVNAKELADGDFKVLVLANWGEYPQPEKGDLLTSVVSASNPDNMFSYDPTDVMPSAERPVPLFGVKRFSGVQFTPEVLTDIGTIHLLRAYAKITVTCPTAGWTMTNVSLTRYNTSGLKGPVGVTDESGYVKNDYDRDYVTAISLPAGVKSASELPFVKTSDSPATFSVYVPEYRNVDADGDTEMLDTSTRIKVNFAESIDSDDPSKLRDYYLDFKYYSGENENVHFNIKRNYWYIFEINKLEEDDRLSIDVDVMPYKVVNLTPDFGIS